MQRGMLADGANSPSFEQTRIETRDLQVRFLRNKVRDDCRHTVTVLYDTNVVVACQALQLVSR
jgi:hypothetical protein